MVKSKVCSFVSQLLDFTENKIAKARTNLNVEDYIQDLIVVDSLISIPSGSSSKFENGIMTFKTFFNSFVEINFYGANALQNALKFVNLQKSNKAMDIQSALGINVFHVSNFRDLKELIGKNYVNRYMLELSVYHSVSENIETLEILEAQFEFLGEK